MIAYLAILKKHRDYKTSDLSAYFSIHVNTRHKSGLDFGARVPSVLAIDGHHRCREASTALKTDQLFGLRQVVRVLGTRFAY